MKAGFVQVRANMVRRFTAGLVVLAVLLTCGPASAQSTSPKDDDFWVSPGFKVSYTIGHGFTYGLELSLLWSPEDVWEQPYGGGFVFNVDTNFDGLTKLRAGAEIIGPFIGLEGGPTLIFADNGTYLGFGLTPWFGFVGYGFYTYTLTFVDAPNIHELGAYLKFSINTDSDGSGGGSDWDWD